MLILRLAVLLAAIQLTLARYQGTLMCEYGGIMTRSFSSTELHGCWHGDCSTTFWETFYSFPTWTSFSAAHFVGVDCNNSGYDQVSLCWQDSYGNWYHTATCPEADEGVISLVHDTQTSRRLGAKAQEVDESKLVGKTEEVDIDGEKWTVFSLVEE